MNICLRNIHDVSVVPYFWPAVRVSVLFTRVAQEIVIIVIVFIFHFQNPEEKVETQEGTDASKSEISLVYEIALKRNLSVNFEVRAKIQGNPFPCWLSVSVLNQLH